jgi:hypothetical protein
VEYLNEKGRLITESLKDFTKKALKKRFVSVDDFLKRWKSAERKQAIIEELENEGLSLEPLADEVGKDFDPFVGDKTGTIGPNEKPCLKVVWFRHYDSAIIRVSVDGLNREELKTRLPCKKEPLCTGRCGKFRRLGD